MLRCLTASRASALCTGSCSFLVAIPPRHPNSARLASGTVPLTPTVTTSHVHCLNHIPPCLPQFLDQWPILQLLPTNCLLRLLKTNRKRCIFCIARVIRTNKATHSSRHKEHRQRPR
eukprot:1184532-Prorocentrum_minimum.AAC.4